MIKHDYLQDIGKKQDAIRHLAAYYRRAADRLRLVKPIIEKFNGKVLNCRFDDALKINNNDFRIYASHRYSRYEIVYLENQNYNDSIILMSGYDCKADNRPSDGFEKAERLIIFSDNKKIQAGKMISLLNDKRAALLQMAAEYDRFAEELPETMRHIQDTANVLNSVLYTIPWHLSGLIGVDRIRV